MFSFRSFFGQLWITAAQLVCPKVFICIALYCQDTFPVSFLSKFSMRICSTTTVSHAFANFISWKKLCGSCRRLVSSKWQTLTMVRSPTWYVGMPHAARRDLKWRLLMSCCYSSSPVPLAWAPYGVLVLKAEQLVARVVITLVCSKLRDGIISFLRGSWVWNTWSKRCEIIGMELH